MSTLEELNAAFYAAIRELSAISKAKNERERILQAETAATLEAEFGESYRAASKIANEARIAKEQEEQRIAIAGAKPKYPVGTMLRLWTYDSRRYTQSKVALKTDFVGTIEIVTSESKFAANLSDYSRPKAGSIIVRGIKKDGTPSLKFETVSSWFGDPWKMWRPEGVEFDAEEKEKLQQGYKEVFGI